MHANMHGKYVEQLYKLTCLRIEIMTTSGRKKRQENCPVTPVSSKSKKFTTISSAVGPHQAGTHSQLPPGGDRTHPDLPHRPLWLKAGL